MKQRPHLCTCCQHPTTLIPIHISRNYHRQPANMGADFYTYIFAVSMVFAFFDSYGIGANDVANSFSTAVGSRTLSLLQACIIASFTEFGGAVLLGSEVSDTIRKKMIKTDEYMDNPGALMLGMLCSLIGSSTWVLTATRFGMPVSTTHATIGSIIGFAVASIGASAVNWGYDKGFASVVTSWFISPVLSGVIAAVIFLITKFAVLNHEPEKSYKIGLICVPIYFAFTFAIEAMFIVWKGSPRLGLSDLAGWKIAVITVSTGIGMCALAAIFLVPWLRRRIENHEDLRWYHIPVVHCVHRPIVEPTLETDDELEAKAIEDSNAEIQATEIMGAQEQVNASGYDSDLEPSGARKVIGGVRNFLVKGYTAEVADYKIKDRTEMHAAARHYDSKVEELYKSLQVLTSALASFAHGANDVANAVGPLATVVYIWENAAVAPKKVPVDIWVLAYGGAGIVVGLWTYGYKIMRALGNQITYHTPSRGFSMELGATLTVLIASKVGIPVSTTHCITGATVGVGLCNGNLKAVNWKALVVIFLGWIITCPAAGLIAGLIFAFVANSPTI